MEPDDNIYYRVSNCDFAHRVTVNAGLLAPICQSAAGVLSIMSHVFYIIG